MSLRVLLVSPDRHLSYDGRTPDASGVGGGITARVSLLTALAKLGHTVTACVNCREPSEVQGVRYVPLDQLTSIDTDVLIAMTTGGALSFAPLRGIPTRAALKVAWVQGTPRPADLEAIQPDYVCAASNFLRDVCVDRWGLAPDRLFVCYNGLSQERFRQAAAAGITRDPFAIAYIGPPDKGLTASLAVLDRLRSRDPRYHLDIFGGAGLWGADTAADILPAGATFRGLLGQEALVPRLFEYEYCLAPQSIEEGFGIAVQEARRAGQIVLASDVGAFHELFRSSVDGFLFPHPHESERARDAMAQRILALAGEPSRRERIRRRGLDTPWDWNLAARTWTAWLDDRLGRRAAPTVPGVNGDPLMVLPDGRHSPATGAYFPDVYPASPALDRLSRPNRVLIGGYYGHGNLGDEAILQVLLDDLRTALPNVSTVVASGDPDATRDLHDVDAVSERDIPALLDAARESDLVLLGGGGLFQDYHDVDPATFLTDLHWGLTYFDVFPALATLAHTPFMLFAVGVGPLRTEAGRHYTRLAFERADAATVRTTDSLNLLRALGAATDGVCVAADPAYLVAPAPRDQAERLVDDLGLPSGHACRLAVALRSWPTGGSDDWCGRVATALDQFADAHDAVILFVPFQPRGLPRGTDDLAVAERVRARLTHPERSAIVRTPLSPAEASGLFRACDLVLAMRLHAAIFAAGAGVPVVALAYDPKVRSAMTEIGLADATLDLDDATVSDLMERLEKTYASRDAIGSHLRAVVAPLRSAARRSVEQAVALLGTRPFAPRPVSPAWHALLHDALAWHIRQVGALESRATLTGEALQTYEAALARADARLADLAAGRDRDQVNLAHAVREAEAERRRVAALTAASETAASRIADLTSEAETARAELTRLRSDLTRATAHAAEVADALARDKANLERVTSEAADAQAMVATLVAEAKVTAGLQRELSDVLAAANRARLEQVVALTDASPAPLSDGDVPASAIAIGTARVQALEAELGAIRNSRAWRAITAYRRVRRGLEELFREPATSASTLARAVLRPSTRTSLRGWLNRRLMDPYAYVFDLYRRARATRYGPHVAGVRTPGEPGLVSVVLPVFNGGTLTAEAIDSVLAQTHAALELIVVDDGSTDGTPEIVAAYARRDPRVRVIRQANQKLPRALSRGFREARGEFLTWTSCDNRLKPECLARLVGSLQRHPCWDLVYGNLDIIGEGGDPLRGSPEYEGYQRPPGSEHITLPAATGALNVWPNNFIGAAFLYRSRVATLIGDYSAARFVSEDYDYWMRVNALLTLRHADVDEPIYDYRFHPRSLTARWAELRMLENRDRLMVFEDFRRDFYLSPLVWRLDGDEALCDRLARELRARGHLVHDDRYALADLPHLFIPLVCVRVTSANGPPPVPDATQPAHALQILVSTADSLPDAADAGWDLCCVLGTPAALPRLARPRQGWLAAADVPTLLHAIDIRARSEHLSRLEREAVTSGRSELAASIVICTNRFGPRTAAAVASALRQRCDRAYEVLLVNNSPARLEPDDRLAVLRAEHAGEGHPPLRIVTCPVVGLSAARNAGISEARGAIVCFLDDDAVAEDSWLARLCDAFERHPRAGVIGGHIHLTIPEPRPAALRPGWEKYWSHFDSGVADYTEVEHWWEFPWGANWAARREALLLAGGFRTRYGRVGDNAWGGEELVAAALIRRLGYAIAILPQATVVHDVDPARFTFRHVLRTLIAGHQVAYLAQRDLYVPREHGLGSTLWQLLTLHADAHISSRDARWRNVLYRKCAQLRLLRAQVGDLRRRLRRAVISADPCEGS